MSEQANQQESTFWLHVPLESIRGDWLKPPPDGRLTVLGHRCRLFARPLHNPGPDMTAPPMVVRQYLLFDPLAETEALKLLDDLKTRMPVLGYTEQIWYRIPGPWTSRNEAHGVYDGPTPSFILSQFEPKPAWLDAHSSSHRFAADLLETKLPACPAVKDERIRTAIDLANASGQDSLPRSIFLSHLTILDSLATRRDRTKNICNWLDEKIVEANKLKESGLASALGNLKRESHGTAIKNLIKRAGEAMEESGAQIEIRQNLAVKLYALRSGLSHSGTQTLDPQNVSDARTLARFVIDAAIKCPSVLDNNCEKE